MAVSLRAQSARAWRRRRFGGPKLVGGPRLRELIDNTTTVCVQGWGTRSECDPPCFHRPGTDGDYAAWSRVCVGLNCPATGPVSGVKCDICTSTSNAAVCATAKTCVPQLPVVRHLVARLHLNPNPLTIPSHARCTCPGATRRATECCALCTLWNSDALPGDAKTMDKKCDVWYVLPLAAL